MIDLIDYRRARTMLVRNVLIAKADAIKATGSASQGDYSRRVTVLQRQMAELRALV